MEPASNNTPPELTQEINDYTTRYTALQRSLGLSNGAFAARYADYLGSEKTWMKLKDGSWSGHVSAERILLKLRQMSFQVDAATNFEGERFIDKLPFIRELNAQFARLMASRNDRRCLTVLAPQGTGKSWWASSRVEQARRSTGESGRAFYLRVSYEHRNKSLHFCNALIRLLGGQEESSPAEAVQEVLRLLRLLQQPLVIFDEAHYGGIGLMRLIKECIDETDGRFVYLGFPTEYDRVRSSDLAAMAEARQFQRRCIQPIFDDWRFGVTAKDTLVYLQARGFSKERDLKTFAESITPDLVKHYNLETLDDAIVAAAEQAADEGGTLKLEDVRQALRELTSTAQERREWRLAAEKGTP